MYILVSYVYVYVDIYNMNIQKRQVALGMIHVLHVFAFSFKCHSFCSIIVAVHVYSISYFTVKQELYCYLEYP